MNATKQQINTYNPDGCYYCGDTGHVSPDCPLGLDDPDDTLDLDDND